MSRPIKQISVLLENEPGAMSSVSELLGKEGINIGAISLADSTEKSIVRLITDSPDKTEQALTAAGYSVWQRDVIAVETPDHPGGLNAMLKPLALAGVNVHYIYPFLRRFGDNAILILRVSDTAAAIDALKESYINIIDDAIYSL